MISPLFLMMMLLLPHPQVKPVDGNCLYKGFQLYGKVKIVTDFQGKP
jgi:hypothetical protein